MIKKTSYGLVLISVYLLSFYNISGQKKVFLSDYDELFSIWDTSQYKDKNNALQLRCPKIDTVKIGLIGLGNRGQMALERLPNIQGVKIVAIADIDSNKVNSSYNKYFKSSSFSKPDRYYLKNDWKEICQRNDVDLIYVCTHLELHTPIALYAMENNKHVAVEVPAALTVKDCWDLVKTAERTKKHCIQLENCMYDFFEISVLNMVQNKKLGEIVHTEGAYIHDLKSLNFSKTYYWDFWRLRNLQKTDGNTYPTHGLGPLAHLLNIHRGDRMTHLVSMSSSQFGLSKYSHEKLPENSIWKHQKFKKGDMNTTLIKTQNGKTIMLQHDVTSPRPYSRIFTVSGTDGFVQKYPVQSMSFTPKSHHILDKEALNDTLLKYEPTIIKNIKEKAQEVGGHGGMDFIMDYRLIYCLRNGLPLDQDVYDAAEWSSIVALSRKSVAKGSKAIKIPDFTRGNWDELNKVTYFLKQD